MPLQNRVTPYGNIVAIPDRGTMMGNRGILHNDRKQLIRTSQVRRWLICVLEYKGIHRVVMSPHHYTELFFLDEATALAAGHRPCCECRRDAYQRFQQAWQRAYGVLPSADDIDNQLQRDRRIRGQQRTYQAPLRDLPDGTLVGWQNHPWLLYTNALYLWTPGGYTKQISNMDEIVTVLTPKATVAVLRAGYVPLLHTSLKQRTF